MKTKSKTWWLPLAVVVCHLLATAPGKLYADGCFVAPKFVWDKHRDINEPTQKAIIIHDAGREEMLLQVKYAGPLNEFGWLIPAPNLPAVTQGSMACFYELSRFTQKNLEYQRPRPGVAQRGTYGDQADEPPVKVIEVKTVGAYEVAVLSTKDSMALENWLTNNQFALPANAAAVLDGYVKQGWYFIAVKISLPGGAQSATAQQLASGELHPLHISFASERCVFPLKISSLNHAPSEVQVYVLSTQPLVEQKSFAQALAANFAWRTNRQATLEASRKLQEGWGAPVSSNLEWASWSQIDAVKLIRYVPVGRKELPVCAREMTLLKNQTQWWLMKQAWYFQPEDMRDLEFATAVPVFVADLAGTEGAFAAANLLQTGAQGISALLAAMQATNPVVRAHAASVAEELVVPSSGNRSAKMNPELLKLLPTLLNDPDPEVRWHAALAAENSASPVFFNRMLGLLRDDDVAVSDAAYEYLWGQYYWWEKQGELAEHEPLFRQMLKDTNANVQLAGLRLLLSTGHAQIPREELLPFLNSPRLELARAAMGYLGGVKNISCAEARPLLQNPDWEVRWMGLTVLLNQPNNQMVEFIIPLLKDPVERVRTRAHDALTALTGQNFPTEASAQWEQWWKENQATFKVNLTPSELRQKISESARQRRAENAAPRSGPALEH